MTSEPRKILILSSTETLGGAHRSAFRLFGALRDMCCCDVDIRTLNDFYGGLFLYRLGIVFEKVLKFAMFKSRFKIFHSSGLYGIISTKVLDGYDVVNVHWISCGLVSLNALNKSSATLIITMHDCWWLNGLSHHNTKSNWFDLWLRKKKANILYKATKIISPSKWLKSKICEAYPELERKTVVIPNVMEFSSIKERAPRSSEAEKSHLKVGIVCDNIFSNISKGASYYRLLFDFVAQGCKENRFQFVVLGRTKTKLYPFVKHVPATSASFSLSDFYAEIDVLLNLSLFENFSNVLVEARLYEKPSVAFNVGGNSEINCTKKNVVLEVEEFSGDAILRLLEAVVNAPFSPSESNQANRFDPIMCAKRHMEILNDY